MSWRTRSTRWPRRSRRRARSSSSTTPSSRPRARSSRPRSASSSSRRRGSRRSTTSSPPSPPRSSSTGSGRCCSASCARWPARAAARSTSPTRSTLERGLALYETAAIDPATLPACFTPDAVERELIRHLLLPLASSGRPLGVVTLLDPVSRDLETLQRMADAGAIALSNALALETARHRADVNRAVLETAHDAFVAVDADAPDHGLVAAGRGAVRVHREGGARRAHRRAGDPGALARCLPRRARRAAGDAHRDAALPPSARCIGTGAG